MATIKSYTDLEQSKKLAEILPIESADACWTNHLFYSFLSSWRIESTPPQEYKYLLNRFSVNGYLIEPAWSLASLFDIIPKHIDEFNVLRIDISTNDFAIWYDKIGYGVNNDLPDITMESAVDACYEMILKLHEQKLL